MNEHKGFYFDFSRIGTGMKFACNLDLLDEIKIISEDKPQTTYQKFWEETSDIIDNAQFEQTIPQLEEAFTQKFEETPEEIDETTVESIELEILEDTAENYIKLNSEIKLEVLKEKYNLSIEALIELLNKNKIEFDRIELIQLYHLGWQDAISHFIDLTMSELKHNTNITAREYIERFPGCNFQEFVNVFEIVPTEINFYARLAHMAHGGVPAAFIPKTLNDLRTYYNNDPLMTIMDNFNLRISDLIHHFDVSFADYTRIMNAANGKYKKRTLNQTVTDYRGYKGISSAVDLIVQLGINHDDFLTYFDKTTLREAVKLYDRIVPAATLLQWYQNKPRDIRPSESLKYDPAYSLTNYFNDIWARRPGLPENEVLKSAFKSITPTLDHIFHTKINLNLNLTIRDILDNYPANTKTESDLANAYSRNIGAFRNVTDFLNQLIAAENKLINPINYVDLFKIIIRMFGPLNQRTLHNLIQDLVIVNFRTLTGNEWVEIVQGLNFVTIAFMLNWSRINHPGGNQFITFTARECVEIFDNVNTHGLSGEVADYNTILGTFRGITTAEFKRAFDGTPLAFANAAALYAAKDVGVRAGLTVAATPDELLAEFPLTTMDDFIRIPGLVITATDLKRMYGVAATVRELKRVIPRTTIAELVNPINGFTALDIALSGSFTLQEIKTALYNNDFVGLHRLYTTNPPLAITPQQIWNLYQAQGIITLNDLIDLYNDIDYDDLALIIDPRKQNPRNFFNALLPANQPTLEVLYETYRQDPNPNPVTPDLAIQLYPATKPSKIVEIYGLIPINQMIDLYHNRRPPIQIDIDDLRRNYPAANLGVDFINNGITPAELPLNKLIELFRNEIDSNVIDPFYGRHITAQELYILFNGDANRAATITEIAKINGITPQEIKTTYFDDDFEGLRNLYLSDPALNPINPQQLWNLYNIPGQPVVISVDDLRRIYGNAAGFDVLVTLLDPHYNNPINFYNAFDNTRKPLLQDLFNAYRPGHPNPVTDQLALQLYDGIKPSEIKQVFNLNLGQMVQLYHNIHIVPQPPIDVEDLFNTYDVPKNSLQIRDMTAHLTPAEFTLDLMVKLFKNELLRGRKNLLNQFYNRPINNPMIAADFDGLGLTNEQITKILELTPVEYINAFNENSFDVLKVVYPDIPIDYRHWDQFGDITLRQIKDYYDNNHLKDNDVRPLRPNKEIYYLRKYKSIAHYEKINEFLDLFDLNFAQLRAIFDAPNRLKEVVEAYLDDGKEDNLIHALKEIARIVKPSWFYHNLDVITSRDPDFEITDLPNLYNNFPDAIEGLLDFDPNLKANECYEILGIELKEYNPININKAYKPPKKIMKAPSQHHPDISEEQLRQYIDRILVEDDDIDPNFNLNDLQEEIDQINVEAEFDLESENYLNTISNMDPEMDYNELYDFDGDLYGGGVKIYSNNLKQQVTEKLSTPADIDQDVSEFSEMMWKILREEIFFKNNCNSIIYADATKNVKMLLTDQLRTCNLLYILYLNYTGDKTIAYFRNFLNAFYKITFTYIHPSQFTIKLIYALVNSIKEESFNFVIENLIRDKLLEKEKDKIREEIAHQIATEEVGKTFEHGFLQEIEIRLNEFLKTNPIEVQKVLNFEDGSIKRKIETVCKWLGFTIPDYYLGLDYLRVDEGLADNIYENIIRTNRMYLIDLSPINFIIALNKTNSLSTNHFTSIFRIIASKTIPSDFNNDNRDIISYYHDETPAEIIKQIYPNHPLIAPLKTYFKEKYKYTMDSIEDFIIIKNLGYFSQDWLLFRAIDNVLQADLEESGLNIFSNSLPTISKLHDKLEKVVKVKTELEITPFAVVYYYCDLLPKIYKYIPGENEGEISSEDLKSFFIYPLDDPLSSYETWKNLRFGKNTRNAFVKIMINSSGKVRESIFSHKFDKIFDFTSALSVEENPDGSVKPILNFKFQNYVNELSGKDEIENLLEIYITLLNKIRIVFYQIIIHHPNISYRDAQLLVGSLTKYITGLKPKKLDEIDEPVAAGIVDEVTDYEESFDLTDFEETWRKLPNNVVVDPSTTNVNIKQKYIYKLKENYNNSFNSSFAKATQAMEDKLQTRHGIMKSMMYYLLTNNFKDGCSWYILKNDIAQYIYDNPDIFTIITYKHVLDVFENEPDSLSLWLLSKYIVETQLMNSDPFRDFGKDQKLNLPISQGRCKQNYLCSILFLWFIGELKFNIWSDSVLYNCNVPCLKGVNTSIFFVNNDANILLSDDNDLKDFVITLLFESVNKLGIDTVNELASEFANTSLKMLPRKLNIRDDSSESIKAFSNWLTKIKRFQYNIAFYYVLMKTLEDPSFSTNHHRFIDDFYRDHAKFLNKRLEEKRISGRDYNLLYKRFLSNVDKISKSGIETLSNTLNYYEKSFKTLVKSNGDNFINLLRTKYLDKLGLFIHITDWLIIVEAFGKYNDELTKLWRELETTDGLILNYEIIKKGFKVKSTNLFNGPGKLLLIEYNKDGSTITRIIKGQTPDYDFFNQLRRELGKEVITLNKDFSYNKLKKLVDDKLIDDVVSIFKNDFINTMYDVLNLHVSAYYDYSVDYVVLTVLKIIIDDEKTKTLIEKVLHLISRTGSVEHIKQIIKCVREVINNPIILIKINHEVYNALTNQSAKFFKKFNDVFYMFDNTFVYPELELSMSSVIDFCWVSKIKSKTVNAWKLYKPGTVMRGKRFFETLDMPHKGIALRHLINLYYDKSEKESDENAFKRVYEFHRFGSPISDEKWPKFYIDLYLLEQIGEYNGSAKLRKMGITQWELLEICYNYVMYKLSLHNIMFSTSINSYTKDLEMYCYNMNKKLIPWLKMYYPYYPVYKIKPINRNEFKEIMYRKSLKHPGNPNDRFKTQVIKNGDFTKTVNPKIDGMYAYNDDNSDDKLTGGDKAGLKGGVTSELPTILKFIIIAFLIIILIAIIIKIVKTFIKKRSKPTKNEV